MVLQMHFASQFDIAPGMGARNGLTLWMVAEMIAMEVPFEVAANRESFQAITDPWIHVPEAKDALRGFTFNRERFRQTR